MPESFDPGALMARHYTLPDGLRVCLRLARVRDRDGIRDLCARHGLEVDELELARLVGFDPRRRLVICATALIGSKETVLGVGAIDLSRDADPWLLVVDKRADGLGPLLADALLGRTRAVLRSRAARAA
jgi:hypothetical protein